MNEGGKGGRGGVGWWGGRKKKSVKKAGYLPSLGEREFPSARVGQRKKTLGFIDKKGRARGEGETMFGIGREQTIICID